MPYVTPSSHYAWFRTLAAAASMSGTLAMADEPVRSGFEHSVGRVGALTWSATAETGRIARRPAAIVRVSAEEPLPMPPAPEPAAVPEPQGEAATARVPIAAPPAAAPFIANGAAEVQYLSSAWPGTWRPPVCSDIAFRPFGDAVMPTIGRQIYQGSVDLMTLYDFDFYSMATQQAAALTPRGLYQLRKFARRLEFTPAAITVQFSESNPELGAARRMHVIQELSALGIANAEALVVLGRARFGVPATEAVQTAVGLESVIENRGRTVTPDSSARFGTGRVFGGFGR